MSKQTRLPAHERREVVLEAAVEVFSERGYGASMSEVAKAAGVTRTVLYYYFPTKKDLILGVLDRLVTELLRYVAPAAAAEGSRKERAREVVRAWAGFVQANPRAWRLGLALPEDADPEVFEVLVEMEEMAAKVAAMLFAQDLEALEADLESKQVRVMAELLVGGSVQLMRWWSRHPDVERAEVEEAIFQLAWYGLRGWGHTT